MRAYGYIRVSKDPEKEKISPDIQRQLIRRYADKHRIELVEIYGDVDIPSAKIDFAGTWQIMVDQLERGDLIITNTASRLGRNLRQTLTRVWELDKIGAEVVSLEGETDRETAVGKYLFHNLLTIAELVNDQHSEQMRAMHAYKAERGEWKGGGIPPFGYLYRVGAKKLEVLEAEAKVVREMYQMRDEGMSYAAITRELVRRGVKGKKGRMNYSSVKQILNNPTYAGKRTHRGKEYEGLHEAIIDLDLWSRVQARNRLCSTRSVAAQRRLLSGLCECGECGSTMIYWSGKTKGRPRRVLQCKEAKTMQNGKLVTMEAHLVEGRVLAEFFRRLDDRRVDAAAARIRKRAPKKESRVQDLRRQLEKVEVSLARLEADRYDYDEPLIDAEQFRRKNAELVERYGVIASELRQVEDEAKLDNVVYLERARARKFHESWEGLTIEDQREALRVFVDKVIIYPRTGTKKIDPSRVKIVWK